MLAVSVGMGWNSIPLISIWTVWGPSDSNSTGMLTDPEDVCVSGMDLTGAPPPAADTTRL